MAEKGTLRIPDRAAMDRVTDLQKEVSDLGDTLQWCLDEVAGTEAEDAVGAVGICWARTFRILRGLGLLGDTAGLAPDDRVTDLAVLAASRDPEVAHDDADRILCELFRDLGYERTARAFERVPKWYA